MKNKLAKKKLKTKIQSVSSLDKVFPQDKPRERLSEYSVLKNETFHYQVAVYSTKIEDVRYEVSSDLQAYISVHVVETIPARFAKYEGMHDRFFIKNHGNNELYPDLLRPACAKEKIRQKSWLTYYITIDASQGLPVGKYEIVFTAYIQERRLQNVFTLTVLDNALPSAEFDYTHWIHCDCIADQHSVELFSEEFYAVYKEYLKSAVGHGMNMLLTPVFTPALDTDVGGYRRCVQLVRITVKEGEYSFDFSPLRKFMQFAQEQGIRYFELSPLATQHGAKYTPQIIADVDGKSTRIFGWDVKADDIKYLRFLDEFLAALRVFSDENGVTDKILFHISDELPKTSVDSTLKIKAIIEKHFEKAVLMDAVSLPETAQCIGLTRPYVCTEKYREFPSDYVYYCGCQRTDFLPNVLFAMPSVRNRAIGFLFYLNGTKGFLHWGFNFYYTSGSRRAIDPYACSDAGGAFDAGDSFLVYPCKDGVLESIRHEVFYEGLCDFRACKLLEEKRGKTFVIQLLKKAGFGYGFSKYPHSAKKLLAVRAAINACLAGV